MAYPERIGSPFQKQFKEIPTSRSQDSIKRAIAFEVGIVAVAKEQYDERMVSRFQRDFQGRGHLPLPRNAGHELQRLRGPDPVLNFVDSAFAAKAMQFSQNPGIGCRSGKRRCGRFDRVRSRIYERCVHRHTAGPQEGFAAGSGGACPPPVTGPSVDEVNAPGTRVHGRA